MPTVMISLFGLHKYNGGIQQCKAVVGGTAGPAMAVPLFSRACNNIVL